MSDKLARAQLLAELDHLESMLPIWREKLRDEAQFQPQFDVLSARIFSHAAADDQDYVRQRIEMMLARHAHRGILAVASASSLACCCFGSCLACCCFGLLHCA